MEVLLASVLSPKGHGGIGVGVGVGAGVGVEVGAVQPPLSHDLFTPSVHCLYHPIPGIVHVPQASQLAGGWGVGVAVGPGVGVAVGTGTEQQTRPGLHVSCP